MGRVNGRCIYFVSYLFTDPNGHMGFGRAEVSTDRPIRATSDIAAMEKNLRSSSGIDSVVVQNFILLEGEQP